MTDGVKNQEKDTNQMKPTTLNYSNTLGRKPLVVDPEILYFYKKADQNDLDAIFELSRYFFDFDYQSEQLQAALYYKSLLVANYPVDYDPYPCAVTLTDIGHIFGLLEEPENAKEWFRKAYRFVFERYPPEERRGILGKVGTYSSLEYFEIELNKLIAFEISK